MGMYRLEERKEIGR